MRTAASWQDFPLSLTKPRKLATFTVYGVLYPPIAIVQRSPYRGGLDDYHFNYDGDGGRLGDLLPAPRPLFFRLIDTRPYGPLYCSYNYVTPAL